MTVRFEDEDRIQQRDPRMTGAHSEFIGAISDLDALAWNALVDEDQPFLRYEFLSALEESQSVCQQSGWQPRHYCLKNRAGELLAAAPMYLKYHSYGEYVFDWAWADAYHRYGRDYYPKLLCAIPFTPCVGPRLLVKETAQRASLESTFVADCVAHCEQNGLSSFHLLFPDADVGAAESNLMERVGIQYHWENKGYASFDAFLETFTSRKRKNVKKERRNVDRNDLDFEWVEGSEIDAADLKRFYSLYVATYFKRGQSPYLNLDFFSVLIERMPDSMVFLFVRSGGQIVAGALFFKGTHTLYGRYWGCLKEFDLLHFETCYYQGIEYCIEHGLSRFDAGAQGEHKLMRGFEPIYTRSYHHLGDPSFEDAVRRFLTEESGYMKQAMAQSKTMLPYKEGLK